MEWGGPKDAVCPGTAGIGVTSTSAAVSILVARMALLDSGRIPKYGDCWCQAFGAAYRGLTVVTGCISFAFSLGKQTIFGQ